MFQHIVVKNFRCFTGLHLKNLARVNLIAGKNNTGKTALLEAMHLHNSPGNWQLPFEINKIRGIQEPAKGLEDICGWLFHLKHPTSGLDVERWDQKGVTRSFSMWIVDGETALEKFPEAEKRLREYFRPEYVATHFPRLVLRYRQSNEPEHFTIGVAGTGSFSSLVARVPWTIASAYLGASLASSTQDVNLFGELEAAKRQQEILPALQIVEPRLQRLALIPLAGDSVIHGDIGLQRLVPIPFMGEGMRRVLGIVLAIANAPDGVVLIDEVENGLHYSVMKDVWKAIALAARQLNVQVLATTHSYECITAAHEAFTESGPYDLRLYRLDRTNGEIHVAAYDQDVLSYAAEMSHEVR
jgi:hypothetical protein